MYFKVDAHCDRVLSQHNKDMNQCHYVHQWCFGSSHLYESLKYFITQGTLDTGTDRHKQESIAQDALVQNSLLFLNITSRVATMESRALLAGLKHEINDPEESNVSEFWWQTTPITSSANTTQINRTASSRHHENHSWGIVHPSERDEKCTGMFKYQNQHKKH